MPRKKATNQKTEHSNGTKPQKSKREPGVSPLEILLAKGKRQYDKRQTITERDQKRDIDRSMKKYRGKK